jgi:hypothetical protein
MPGKQQRRAPKPSRRSGSAAIELLILIPILAAAVLAVVQYGLMIAANQQLEAASAVGARVASQGGGPAEVEHAVKKHLGDGRLRQADVLGKLTDEHGYPLTTGETVVVVVQIPAEKAVPDLLRFIGISIKGQTLSGQTALRKE